MGKSVFEIQFRRRDKVRRGIGQKTLLLNE
jgi:hypothetical protein